MVKILIADDEPSIVLALRDELSFESFEVDAVGDGREAADRAREFRPDILLLDLALPSMNGFDVLRTLRPAMPELWIIVLSVRAEEVDRVMALELGADDYVTKPFSLREVVARIRVGLRRQQGGRDRTSLRFGSVEIAFRSHRVTKGGREVALTRSEFRIMELLSLRAGEAITRDEFLDAIWGRGVYLTPRVVDTHIAALRKKLEDDPEDPRLILSVRGVGYRLGEILSRS